MEFGQTNFREIDLFDFKNIFGLDFFNFSGPLCSFRILKIFESYLQCPRILFFKEDDVDIKGAF